MSTQFVGWSQPPHPIDVIPSFDPASDSDTQSRAVIWDFMHDDDVRNWADKYKVLATGVFWPKITDIDPAELWLFYTTGRNSATPQWESMSAATGAPQLLASSPQALTELRAAVDKAKAKRSSLGPLPSNSYADPITIYYYDNDHIKRVSYPLTAIGTGSDGKALDPKNIHWWKDNGITTGERNDDGTWGDEGFDYNKDVAGSIGPILGSILAIVGTVLVATGVGAAAGAALLAAAPILASYANVIDTAFQGGDLNTAVGGFLKAIGAMIGANQVPAGISKDLLKAAATQLQKLQSLISNPAMTGLDFADAYAKVRSELATFGPVTDEQVKVLSDLLGRSAGTVLEAGYRAASYANPATLQGAASVLPDTDSKNLFVMGAYLGSIRQDQLTWSANHAGVPPMGGLVSVAAHVSAAQQDLANYVHNILFPRYGLKS